ncbi:F-box protein SKIP5-like, partial [Manihot esculenta]|uniref:F-box protein SKIP5-like n=1 Tax=Manihot esculenta TaxID=3983 RepID=UPI001CC828EF
NLKLPPTFPSFTAKCIHRPPPSTVRRHRPSTTELILSINIHGLTEIGTWVQPLGRSLPCSSNVHRHQKIGGGEAPDETTLLCSRGSDSALEFLSTCKLANLTVKAELGCCLLHRSGRLTIDGCILQCESNPLDYLSCPIVTTAGGSEIFSYSVKTSCDGVSVSQTRIEGGSKAVVTSGKLALQRVRVICSRTCVYFWFDVEDN